MRRRTTALATLAALSMLGGAALARDKGKSPDRGKTRDKATIVVKMVNFKSDRGYMRIALFRGERGFPGKPKLALMSGTARIKKGKSSFVFKNVPRGRYAISVLHDENGNGKMDTNWVGIPKEGGGTSRDARARFGPPDYKDAVFAFDGTTRKLTIKIRY